jgi:3-methyl-2-oxobutanoate hydroxymethyltransferase
MQVTMLYDKEQTQFIVLKDLILWKDLTQEDIPVVGHVGFVPYKSSWFGGPKAGGKNLEDALEVFNLTMSYQDAGAIGVEMEIVPDKIAKEISKSVKILVIGMGSGN